MTRNEIIDLVQVKGGYVSLAGAGDDRPLMVFSSLIGCDGRCGMQSWEFSLLLVPGQGGWKIRFAKDSYTRLLAGKELKDILIAWLKSPAIGLLKPYVPVPGNLVC